MKKIVFFVLALFSLCTLNSQSLWKRINTEKEAFRTQTIARKNLPTQFNLFSLEVKKFKMLLTSKAKNTQKVVNLPNEKGGFQKFSVKEISNFEKGLAKKFPNIKTFLAKGIDDPTAYAKISIGTDGVHISISSSKHPTLYIDPYTKNRIIYIAYLKKSVENKKSFLCKTHKRKNLQKRSNIAKRTPNDSKLRTFRLALACTSEYAQFHLNNQNTPTTATASEKKAVVLSAMNTTLTRVNEIYMRDLSLKMVLVDNNDKIIFLNPTSELSNNNASILIEQSQKVCDSLIGNANYDIGHTFSTGAGGLAGIGVACKEGEKAYGVTGSDQPINDPYNIDFVTHEIGHQFGADHTFNNSCDANRNDLTAVEPGSGSTVMGYAGICNPSIKKNSDSYFHSVSINEIWSFIKNATCAQITNTNNTPPSILDGGVNVYVPKSTPLVLKAKASDNENANSVTYCWEQIDNGIATMPPVSTNTKGPLFRSLPPTSSPYRYLPSLQTVVASTTNEWEVLPSIAREMNFSLTVRDNNLTGGASTRNDIKVTVTDSSPFTVTSQNTTATVWNAGSTETISWNTSSTNVAPINCKNVRIKLSTDGGLTFPTTLAESTPNDGTHTINAPYLPTKSARIMVEAVDNIFYNVNSANFTIISTNATFLVKNNTKKQEICNTNNEVNYTLDVNFLNGFNEAVTLKASGFPKNAQVTFSPSTITSNGSVTMNISNLKGGIAKEYAIKITASSQSITQTANADLKIKDGLLSEITLNQPANSEKNIGRQPKLEWSKIKNAELYTIEMATDIEFKNIVLQANDIKTNSYLVPSLLKNLTTYYWRVKAKNNCTTGSYSKTANFTTEAPSYCKSTFTEPKNNGYIINVSFNTINNTINSSSVPIKNGYRDFTPIATKVKPSGTYQAKVSFNTNKYQNHCYVFIDWNQDFEFNTTNERYDLGTLYTAPNIPSAPGPLTKVISVPSDARLGTTRMRVVVEYTDNKNIHGSGACDTNHKSEWGETQDYTIEVSKEDGIALLYPNPTNGKVTLKFDTTINTTIAVKLFNVEGKLISNKKYKATTAVFFKEVNFNVSAGLYLLQINNGEDTKTMKVLFY